MNQIKVEWPTVKVLNVRVDSERQRIYGADGDHVLILAGAGTSAEGGDLRGALLSWLEGNLPKSLPRGIDWPEGWEDEAVGHGFDGEGVNIFVTTKPNDGGFLDIHDCPKTVVLAGGTEEQLAQAKRSVDAWNRMIRTFAGVES